VHLARRSLANGGDSELSSDGNEVGMARILSTSASGGRDMEVCGQIVILAPVVVVLVEGGGMMGSVPSGGETSSSVGETTGGNGCSLAESMCSSSSGIYSWYIGSSMKSGSCGYMNIGSCSSLSCGAGGVCGSSGPGI
nr:hypothetical protein [Tanacetum cinerariifolium]